MIDKRRIDDEGNLKAEPESKINWKIKPRWQWALIREMTQEEQKTAAGIVIPGADFFMNEKSPKHAFAKIVELSDQIKDLEVGDIVITTKFSMLLEDLEYFTGDSSLKLVRDEEIYCSVKPCP